MNKNRKEERQKEAKERRVARAERTDKEQINKLNRDGWKAIKETTRLQKRIKAKDGIDCP